MSLQPKVEKRRGFLARMMKLPAAAALVSLLGPEKLLADSEGEASSPDERLYAMGIQVDKCIGCGMCVDACKAENDVLREPFFFRTWVERYEIHRDGEVTVESIGSGTSVPTLEEETEAQRVRSFFVPKLCNHCDNPPCVQVCPVGATFKTQDGVILVDSDYCIGCRYCIQACPYGARYLDPRTKTADKCTFCYHRITQDLLPACVEVCPTQARVFGELGTRSSPLHRMKRMNSLQVLKPSLNTEPKVFYSDLDGEVR
jgi:Fe-S-cluster-containing dehydrogenase component